MSAGGDILTQSDCYAYQESMHDGAIIICGHYEGVDARIFKLFDIKEISIGEYVLSSGELSALVFADSIVRLLP